MRPSRLATLALFILAALVAPVQGPDARAAVPTDFYGVNAQGLFALPDHIVETHLEAMSAGSLDFVRRDASWDAAEPNPPDRATGQHSYHWEKFDQEVTAYAMHNLRWLPILDYSTRWSGETPGDFFSPPARVEDYAAYAAAFARRYGAGGSFWREHAELPYLPVKRFEIWNEPNAEFFWHADAAAAERYADLLMAAGEAIRDVDPTAAIVVGGLAVENTDVLAEDEFIRAMVRHRPELVGSVDAVGYHPYAPSAEAVLRKIRDFRSALTEAGFGDLPIEVTEVGWTTSKTTEETRASALRRLADELPRTNCNIGSLAPHTWVTREADSSNPEDWFGIFNANATPKLAGEAYLAAAAQRKTRDAGVPVALCASTTPPADPPAPQEVRAFRRPGPFLQLRVERHGPRGRWLKARLRCPAGCRMAVAVRVTRRLKRVITGPIGRRSFGFASQRRTARFRLPIRATVARVRATAVGVHGGRTVRAKRLVLHARRRSG